jgi:hypothetical protein
MFAKSLGNFWQMVSDWMWLGMANRQEAISQVLENQAAYG